MDSIPEDSSNNASASETVPSIDEKVERLQAQLWQRESTAILAWVNAVLKPRMLHAHSLDTDFGDGVLLINLLEVVLDKDLAPYKLAPKMPFHKMDNVTKAFRTMKGDGIRLIRY
jgi:Calponin homology (CH) domain